MTTVLLNTAGAGTWTVPGGLSANNTITIEGWGGGGGGGSRSSGSAFGSGGGGGAYTSSTYTLTSNDITNGVPYVVAAGAAGGSGGDGASGNASTWSTNNLNILTNSLQQGAAVGVLPTNWTASGTPTPTITNVGVDATTGLPYIDVQISGTTVSTHCSFAFDGLLACSASTAYNVSVYLALVGGATTNITSTQVITDDWTSSSGFLAAIITNTVTLTSTLAQTSGHGTTASTGVKISAGLQLNWTAGKAVNLTIRVAGAQVEAGTSASAWKSTPGYMSAPGGARSNGASGGAGGVAGIGTGTKNTGGAGAAYNAAGAGGGGSAGPDGAGNAGTTSGVGGQGDATTGGAGGAVSTTSPGNAGTANVSGGGGGGALTTVGGTGTAAGAGGAPGGGGGGQVFFNGSSNGTGGAGAIGQIRITYSSGVINLLSLAAASAQGFGLVRQTALPMGLSSPEAFSLGRLLSTSYIAHAASAQSASRVLSALRSVGAASAQAASYARTIARTRGFGAASPQSGSYSRMLTLGRSYGAASAESAAAIARRAKLQSASANDPQSSGLLKGLSKGFGAAAAQAFGLRRATAAFRLTTDAQSAHLSRTMSKPYGVSSSQSSSISRLLVRGVLGSVGSAQAVSLQRLISRLTRTSSPQSPYLGRSTSHGFAASTPQSPRIARQSARSFQASSAYTATIHRAIGVTEGMAQGQSPEIVIASGGVVLGWTQDQSVNVARVRELKPFIALMSAAQGIVTWFHTFVPLASRLRVVRLPPSGAISTLPPMVRSIILPREDTGVLDYQIHRAEPEFFSPFDPTDRQIFTFDWSVRGYANDAIIAAEITGVTPTPGLPPLNFIGPTFIDSYVIPSSVPPTLGYLVSVMVGEFTPLYTPVTYTLRCSVTFASGRIGNWSIPFNVKSL